MALPSLTNHNITGYTTLNDTLDVTKPEAGIVLPANVKID